MASATTSFKRSGRERAKARRSSKVATPAATEPGMQPSPRTDSPRYALVAGKSVAATILVFGAVCALIYTAAEPHKATYAVGEKRVARQKAAEASADTTRLGSALVSKIDVAVREAPRRNARILDKAVYGSYVEVIGQDGKWIQVRATGQNVTGWVERAGLNF